MKRIRFCDRNAKTHFCDKIFSYYVGGCVGGCVGGATQTPGFLNLHEAAGWTSLGLQPLDLGVLLVPLRVVIRPLVVDFRPGRVNFRPLWVDFWLEKSVCAFTIRFFCALNIFEKCLHHFFSCSVSNFYWGGGGGVKGRKSCSEGVLI